LEKLKEKGFITIKEGKYNPQAISKWIHLSHEEILYRYNAIIRGYSNFFSFVDNKKIFHKIVNYILRHSCAKTLSRKFRLKSRNKTFKKFGKKLGTGSARTSGSAPTPVGLRIPENWKNTPNTFKINQKNEDPL
jgi:hypothetical protein